MKSHDTTDSSSGKFTRLHWFLCIVGIVIAIACSLVLLKDMKHTTTPVRKTASVSSVIDNFLNENATTSISILVNF